MTSIPVNTPSTPQDPARSALSTQKELAEFQRAIGTPERCAFPVIVALHGAVVGLGVDLASACDIRYAASNTAFSVKVSFLCIFFNPL